MSIGELTWTYFSYAETRPLASEGGLEERGELRISTLAQPVILNESLNIFRVCCESVSVNLSN